jgi:outer membrane receptor protein involved in Fe transport
MAESGDFTKALALIGEALGSEIRLTYAEGLRLPSLADRYASNQYYVGNPRLRPERSQSWEIGFRMSPETRKDVRGTGVSFEVSTFDTIFFDFIDNTSLGGLLRTKVNTGTSRARGAEFALGYATALGQVAAAYGYLDAKNVDTGESLRLAPHHQLALSAAHQFGVIVAELKDTIWSEFQDRDLTNALRTLPGWNSLDLTLRTKGLSDWEIEAGVMNILDQPREMTIGFPEPQRRYQVSAMRNF